MSREPVGVRCKVCGKRDEVRVYVRGFGTWCETCQDYTLHDKIANLRVVNTHNKETNDEKVL